MKATAKEFVNYRLGDKNYTHTEYPMHREEIEEWMESYATQRVKAALEEAAEKRAISFANFIGDRPLPEYSASINKWRWWDNKSREYKTATTEELYNQFLSLIPSDKTPCDCKNTCDELTEEGEKLFTCNGLPESIIKDQ